MEKSCGQLVPEIDGIVGTGAYASIVDVLDEARAGCQPVRLDFEAPPEHDFLPRLITTPRATAYLKVAEGCDHPCTFCIIPQLRGTFRSRSRQSILSEARALAAAGTKELILIAQDTSMYGRDRGERRGGLAQLLAELHDIDGLEWLRLLYLYPATVDAELIEALATLPKVCRYIDMPLQHVHPDVLRAMRRPSNGERYLEVIDDFRSRIPGLTVRSTFIVGFPGETDEHVAYLEEWLGRAALDRVGFFLYSPRKALRPRVCRAAFQRRRSVRVCCGCVMRSGSAGERARTARLGRTERVLVESRKTLRRSDPLRAALGVGPGVEWTLDGRSSGRRRPDLL